MASQGSPSPAQNLSGQPSIPSGQQPKESISDHSFGHTMAILLDRQKVKLCRSLCRRGVVLFLIGIVMALVLNLLQVQNNVTLFPPETLDSISSSAWWVAPFCGSAAVLVGLLYPCIDDKLGETPYYKREWSHVMRCLAVFVGINHACAKIEFANNLQFSLTLAAMSLGLWWLFDRSRSGFGLALTIAFLATLITQLLVYKGVYRYTEPDFLYVRSWLPCVFFSGGVTIGNIGRQLALVDRQFVKEHMS